MQTSTREFDRDGLPDELRRWAKGSYPLEAATELLIRTGWCRASSAWIREREEGAHWVDFASIPGHSRGKSSGERQLLLVIASLGDGTGDTAVCLGDVGRIDRDNVDLILAAIAHAAGTHENAPAPWESNAQTPPHTLHPWPESPTGTFC